MTDQQTHEQELYNLLELDLEYRLTIAIGVEAGSPCSCAMYLIRRREVLLPEILKQAQKKDTSPADEFHRFALALHERNCGGQADQAG